MKKLSSPISLAYEKFSNDECYILTDTDFVSLISTVPREDLLELAKLLRSTSIPHNEYPELSEGIENDSNELINTCADYIELKPVALNHTIQYTLLAYILLYLEDINL